MRARPILAGAAVCCGFAALLSAQQPTFRSRVDHVTLDVVVTDKDEVPVTGLTAKDFQIVEHDKPQTLADFTPVTIPARPALDPEAAALPARDVATNAATTERSRAIVFLVGTFAPKDIAKTQRVLIKMFESLTADDQAAVVYVRSSTVSQDFTNDVGRLVSAAGQMRFAMQSGGPSGPKVIQFAVDNALKALDAAKQPRKLLVWVAQGGTVAHGTLEKLQRAGIPIYPIDPIAMQVTMPRGQEEFAEPPSFPDLAANTGGHDYLHPGDPVATAGELMAANSTFYLLGYYPSPYARDDQFHEVKVAVSGHPDWHVRARSGYWARTDKPATDAATGLNKELGAGLDDPGLPLQVFATPIAPADKGLMRTLITTTVRYPAGDASQPALDDQLRIGIVALDADGAIKGEHQRVVPLKGGSSAGALTLVVDDAIDLPAKTLTLRVGVSSQARGMTGTAHLHVDVPDVHKDDVTLGGVALGFATRGALVINPAAITGLLPFHPSTTREFAASDSVRVFCRVFWKGGPKAPSSIAATVRVADSSISKSLTLNGTATGDLKTATLDTVLPLAGLTSGAHVIEVEAQSRDSKQPVLHQIVIDVH